MPPKSRTRRVSEILRQATAISTDQPVNSSQAVGTSSSAGASRYRIEPISTPAIRGSSDHAGNNSIGIPSPTTRSSAGSHTAAPSGEYHSPDHVRVRTARPPSPPWSFVSPEVEEAFLEEQRAEIERNGLIPEGVTLREHVRPRDGDTHNVEFDSIGHPVEKNAGKFATKCRSLDFI